MEEMDVFADILREDLQHLMRGGRGINDYFKMLILKMKSTEMLLTENEGWGGELVYGTEREGIVGFSHFDFRITVDYQQGAG